MLYVRGENGVRLMTSCRGSVNSLLDDIIPSLLCIILQLATTLSHNTLFFPASYTRNPLDCFIL